MYITEKTWYENGYTHIRLIWKTQDTEFKRSVERYRDGKFLASLQPFQFTYSRRGDYLVADGRGSPVYYPDHWAGIGEWRVDPNIRGNVRGCV